MREYMANAIIYFVGIAGVSYLGYALGVALR